MEQVLSAPAAQGGIGLDFFPKTAQMHQPRATGRVVLLAGFLAYLGLLAGAAWLVGHAVPNQIAVRVMGHAITLHEVRHKIFSNAALLLVILPSVLWLECVVTGWKHSSCRQLLSLSPTIRTDIACLLLDQAHLMGPIGRLMMLGLSIISGAAIAAWLRGRTGFVLDPTGLPLVVQVVLYFYVYSFFDYWAHRIGHTKLFWPLHRYHHAAQEFSVVNAERIHPAGFVGIFLINIPMAVLGATPEAMIWVNAATVALGYVIHSRLDWDFGWVGRTIIQSPMHHRLHHKLDMSQPTGFFAMAPVWDRLFGGWSARNDRQVAIGVDTPYRQGFWVMPDLLRDYRDFFLGLVGRRRLSASETG